MHINILCLWPWFQTTSTTFENKRKNIQYLLSNVIYKYVYLNNLMNICFIYYFLFVKLKERFISATFDVSSALISYRSDVQMELECDSVAFSRGNGSRIKLFLKSTFYWWTVSLCHFRGKRCYFNINSAKLVLSFEVGSLFVGLFNKLFMTKCEQIFVWN